MDKSTIQDLYSEQRFYHSEQCTQKLDGKTAQDLHQPYNNEDSQCNTQYLNFDKSVKDDHTKNHIIQVTDIKKEYRKNEAQNLKIDEFFKDDHTKYDLMQNPEIKNEYSQNEAQNPNIDGLVKDNRTKNHLLQVPDIKNEYSKVWNKRSPLNKRIPWKILQKE